MKQFVQLQEEEFISFANSHELQNFIQSIETYRIKKASGRKCFLLGLKENDNIIAASLITGTPLLKGKYYRYYAQRGYLIDYHNRELLAEFTNHIASFLKGEKGLFLKIDPYLLYQEHDKNADIVKDGFNNDDCLQNLISLGYEHKGFTTTLQTVSQPRWMMSLSLLDKNEKDIWKDFDSLRQRSIKKTIKYEIEVKPIPKEDFWNVCYPMIEETCQTKGFEDQQKVFWNDYLTHYDDERFTLMGAFINPTKTSAIIEKEINDLNKRMKALSKQELDDKTQIQITEVKNGIQAKEDMLSLLKNHTAPIPVAVNVYFINNKEMVYFVGGQHYAYKNFNAPYAIQWHMMQTALQQNLERYNFYGQSGSFTKDSPDYSVFQFKRGFNACVDELIGDFILPLRTTVCKLYALQNPLQ